MNRKNWDDDVAAQLSELDYPLALLYRVLARIADWLPLPLRNSSGVTPIRRRNMVMKAEALP